MENSKSSKAIFKYPTQHEPNEANREPNAVILHPQKYDVTQDYRNRISKKSRVVTPMLHN